MIRCLLLCCLTSSAFAALPPLWQGVAEIEAILKSPELGKELDSGEGLQGLYRNADGWIIETNKRKVQAVITHQPQDRPGPQKFTVSFTAIE